MFVSHSWLLLSAVQSAFAIPFGQPCGQGLGSQLSKNATIYTAGEAGFANVTERWTSWHAPTFSMAVEPATVKDVQVCVNYATKNNMNFFAQGRGHGYSGTLEVLQNALQINMINFDTVSFNSKDNTVTVGGGVNFTQIVDAAYAHQREVPVGSGPCVGVLGAALAGGAGRIQGKWGLTQDAIKSLQVVLADGSLVHVSEKENTDLWWAMRGAGQNFGIVVSAVFNTYPQTINGLHYDAEMTFSPNKLESIVNIINKNIPTHPPELAVSLLFAPDPTTLEPVMGLSVIYAGPEGMGRKYAAPYKGLGPATYSENVYAWNELSFKTGDGAVAASCETSVHRSAFSNIMKRFDPTTMRAAWNAFGDFLKAYPNAAKTGSGHLWEIFGTQGVKAVPSNSSAFANREEFGFLWNLVFQYTDTSIEPGLEKYGQTWRKQLTATSGQDKLYVYTNYARGDEPLGALYGYDEGRLEKLRDLKKKYDPENYFGGYHSVLKNGWNYNLTHC